MPRIPVRFELVWIIAAVSAPNLSETAHAQTVWSGLTVEFSKAIFADPTLPENQDRITDNVWLTRASNKGIYNIRKEVEYDQAVHTAPADTAWATDINNPSEPIVATNWEDLQFTTWVNAYGGPGSNNLPARLIGRNAVVHLITDNVYLDLQFTEWSQGAGGFSYLRATGMLPPPSTTGDYNGNGVVDAADYVVWRKTLGQSVAMQGDGADGDRSGTIDNGDYDFWRSQFGNIIPAPAMGASVAVPEPTSACVLLIGLIASKWYSGWRVRRSE